MLTLPIHLYGMWQKWSVKDISLGMPTDRGLELLNSLCQLLLMIRGLIPRIPPSLSTYLPTYPPIHSSFSWVFFKMEYQQDTIVNYRNRLCVSLCPLGN